MNSNELREFLFQETEREKYYLIFPNELSPRYKSMSKSFIDGKEVLNFSLPKLLEEEILIAKDSRYTFVPFYKHTNVNINYIFSGECTYLIDGEYITLRKGDVCIFDKDVIRSKMKTSKEDIVINISISNDFFTKGAIKNIGEQSIIASFIVNALSKHKEHNHFLIFRTNKSERIISLFDSLLIEYFSNLIYSKESISSYLNIIFIELLRLDNNNQYIKISNDYTLNIMEILHYIEKNYTNCTLNNLADHLGYHPKYLSSFIKKNTGKTFKQIQLDQRMKIACIYLKNTNYTIEKVSNSVGITNMNYFYKKFFDIYNQSPNEYRHLR